MRWLVVALILVPIVLSAEGKRARPHRPKITVEAGPPNSAFECDTAKAKEWYGSEARCREELCGGKNASNAYVDGPDGRLRRNPCDHRLRDR